MRLQWSVGLQDCLRHYKGNVQIGVPVNGLTNEHRSLEISSLSRGSGKAAAVFLMFSYLTFQQCFLITIMIFLWIFAWRPPLY